MTAADEPAPARTAHRQRHRPAPSARAFWMKQMYTWHWISSAICLFGMLLFTVTGITLNHAGAIEASPVVTTVESELPQDLLAVLQAGPETGRHDLPAPLSAWLKDEMGVTARGLPEWSDFEVYLGLPRPGGDGWLSIDRETGEILHEVTDRGWISYLNDLHKGRNTGTPWLWFIDIFAVAALVFCITGLLLLQFHARRRPTTWPVVGAGLVIPVLLAIFLVH